jgi:hypothetical protein
MAIAVKRRKRFRQRHLVAIGGDSFRAHNGTFRHSVEEHSLHRKGLM